MTLTKKYKDSTGKECTIMQLVRTEPGWAANRIQAGEDAIARVAELEAEISERRLDYTEDCKRLEAKIAELNDTEAKIQQLTTELDSLRQQLASAQERNVVLQSEHLDHVAALHKRIKEQEAVSEPNNT